MALRRCKYFGTETELSSFAESVPKEFSASTVSERMRWQVKTGKGKEEEEEEEEGKGRRGGAGIGRRGGREKGRRGEAGRGVRGRVWRETSAREGGMNKRMRRRTIRGGRGGKDEDGRGGCFTLDVNSVMLYGQEQNDGDVASAK